MLASVVVHQVYYAFLILSYRYGDLSDVYPIARGIAPLLVAAGAFVFVDEALTATEVIAVLLISAGIISLAFTRGRTQAEARALVFALLTGLTIAAYTVIDGMGGRASGEVVRYIACLFALEAVPFSILLLVLRRGRIAASILSVWRSGVLGGLLAVLAYGIVIWAMSKTYLTFVSALRETSVVIAALIGTRLLGEPFGRRRVAGAWAVVLGVVWLNLG